MIEKELSQDDFVSKSVSSEEELESVSQAPNYASIYPPILVIEKDQELASILVKSSDLRVSNVKS